MVDLGVVEDQKINLTEQNFVLIRPQRPKKSTFWVDFVGCWAFLVEFWACRGRKQSTFGVDFGAFFVDFWACSGHKNQLFELILLIFGSGTPKNQLSGLSRTKNQLFELILLIFGLGPVGDQKINFLS